MATITETIGTTSRDHSTITLWEANLDDDPTYDSGDDAVGECYNDSVFDEVVVIDGGSTIGLASIKLTVANGEEHDGTAGNGVRIVETAGTGAIILDCADNTVDITLELLEFDLNDSAGTGVDTGTKNVAVHRIIIHSTTRSSGDIKGVVFKGDGTATQNITNSIIYDLVSTSSGGGKCAGVEGPSASGPTINCMNITVHNVSNDNGNGFGFCYRLFDVSKKVYKNLVGTDPSGTSSGNIACYSDASYDTADATHNLASDTTASGTGSIDSATTADQFVSTTVGSEDLHLKLGSDAIDAGTDLGTTPSGVEIDIDGRDRDSEGDTWDMGAHEFVAAALDSIWPILWRRRRR